MIRIPLIIGCLLSTFYITAQQRIDMGWQESPETYELSPEDQELSAVVLFNYEMDSFSVDKVTKAITRVITVHRRIRLNNEEAIDAFNKLVLPYNETFKISGLEGRTISSNGKVTPLNKKNIEEAVDEDGIKKMLIAFEDINTGSDVEYSYSRIMPVNRFNVHGMDLGVKTLLNYYEINLSEMNQIDLKTYNGIDAFVDTSNSDRQIIYAALRNVPESTDEGFAFPGRYQPRLEYSLSYFYKDMPELNPFYVSQNRLVKKNAFGLTGTYDWDFLMPIDRDELYDSKVMRRVRSILKKMDLPERTKDQIFAIENYIKDNYDYAEVSNMSLDELVKASTINPEDATKLFAAFFLEAEIPFYLGYTCNRAVKEFDPDLPNKDNMELAFFYFPNYKMYLSPVTLEYRAPVIPAVVRENNSILYDTELKYKKTHKIAALTADENYHNHDVKVKFNKDLDSVYLNTKQSFLGDSKMDVLPYLKLLEGEQKQEFLEAISVLDEDADDVKSITWDVEEWSSLNRGTPTEIKSELSTAALIESLGNDEFLLNIGMVIGRQAELSDVDNERVYDIDLPTAHQLMRTIELNIPKGYRVKNISDLDIDKQVVDKNGTQLCYFTSKARMDGDKVLVDVKEEYLKSHLPKALYPEFKSVINAAAEFNKVSLLLVKD